MAFFFPHKIIYTYNYPIILDSATGPTALQHIDQVLDLNILHILRNLLNLNNAILDVSFF